MCVRCSFVAILIDIQIVFWPSHSISNNFIHWLPQAAQTNKQTESTKGYKTSRSMYDWHVQNCPSGAVRVVFRELFRGSHIEDTVIIPIPVTAYTRQNVRKLRDVMRIGISVLQ